MTRTQGSRRSADTSAADYAMTLRLNRPLATRLNLAALATDQASSEIVRTALAEYLDRLEADPANRAAYDQLRAALPAAVQEGP